MQEMRQPPDPSAFARMNSAEMRDAFLLEGLFVPGKLKMFYSHVERAIVGGAVPCGQPLALPTSKELVADYFTQRRELGVINIGGAGRIEVDGRDFALPNKELLYIGRGSRDIRFHSRESGNPAQFYFVSYPAHAAFPCAQAGKAQAFSSQLGSGREANRRTINRVIHPSGIQSCQLVMGFTELQEGSVWNTMPAHTHARRSEIYLYFDLPEEGLVIHCMGEPKETRHLLVRDRQAVVSPDWSMHFGVGTANYSFVWSMGGENQEFTDMDVVPMEDLG